MPRVRACWRVGDLCACFALITYNLQLSPSSVHCLPQFPLIWRRALLAGGPPRLLGRRSDCAALLRHWRSIHCSYLRVCKTYILCGKQQVQEANQVVRERRNVCLWAAERRRNEAAGRAAWHSMMRALSEPTRHRS